MKRILIIITLALIIILVSSCSYIGADLISYALPNRQAELTIDTGNSRYSNSIIDFSLKLIKEAEKEENVLLSPLSVYLCLAMAVNGAGGETLSELLTLYNLNNEELNQYCYFLIDSLNDNRGNSDVSVFNSMWCDKNKGFQPDKEFLDINALYFNAEIYRDDFSEKAVKNINKWVSIKTKKMINKIIDSIDPMTVMILINTLYFNSDWLDLSYVSVNNTFNNYYGESTEHEFFMGGVSKYFYSDNAKAVRLNLNDDYSFMGILPNSEDIDNYISLLDLSEYMKLMNKSNSDKSVLFRLPNLRYDYKVELSGSMEAMGIKRAFMPYQADFTRIGSVSTGNLYISEINHNTAIDMDKKGVKAAAATSIPINLTSVPSGDLNIIFDRPFVYFILDNWSGAPLFAGVVRIL